jgi:hypothetical protein
VGAASEEKLRRIVRLLRFPKDGDAADVRSWEELMRALGRVTVGSKAKRDERHIDLVIGGTAIRLNSADATRVANELMENTEDYIGRLGSSSRIITELRTALRGGVGASVGASPPRPLGGW